MSADKKTFAQKTIPLAGESVAGESIVARFYAAQGSRQGAVLIVAAMGVTQDYYRHLAAWLSKQGYTVATFDYRGMGLSRSGSLRGVEVDILDWARQDCAAMVDALAQAAPGEPMYWVGHSLGAQILPFVPNLSRVSKVVAIATGSGYWLENAAPLKRKAWFFWFFVVPLCLRLFGYFPGNRMRMVGDLPLNVARQWKRWCMHPEYVVGSEGGQVRSAYSAVRTPLVWLSFTDDEMMSARNTDSMRGFYDGAPCTAKRIAPSDIGVPRIGHMGFFRQRFEEALWRGYLLPELSDSQG